VAAACICWRRIRLEANRWQAGPDALGWAGDQRPKEGGRMRIGLTGIFVDDQDRAERFYTEVLGFNV
jgi:catechol-2,3-dioxygenase